MDRYGDDELLERRQYAEDVDDHGFESDRRYDGGGQSAWRVHRTSTLVISGTQQQSNQQITMEGTGTGEAMYYIGTNGVYLGSTSTQTMNETVKAEGMVIPVTQTATSTVTIIK